MNPPHQGRARLRGPGNGVAESEPATGASCEDADRRGRTPGASPLLGIADVSIPSDGLSGNLAEGRASGVLAQFVPAAGRDGHFVVFDDPKARAQAAAFLTNLAADPKGRIPAL